MFVISCLLILLSCFFQLCEYKSGAEKAEEDLSKHQRELRDKDTELRQLEQLLAGEKHLPNALIFHHEFTDVTLDLLEFSTSLKSIQLTYLC